MTAPRFSLSKTFYYVSLPYIIIIIIFFSHSLIYEVIKAQEAG